jgi:hypothetical protein
VPRCPGEPIARPLDAAWRVPRRVSKPIARPQDAAWRVPRRVSRPIARPPLATWRVPRRTSKPIAQMPCAAWRHRCQIPDVRAGRPALLSFPGFPLGRIPSSVVRDFYCQSAAPHKAFPRELQDSFFIHRTSAVYPLCTADFHRAVHSFIHSSRGLLARQDPAGDRRARKAQAPGFSVLTTSGRRGRSETSGAGWLHQLRQEGTR